MADTCLGLDQKDLAIVFIKNEMTVKAVHKQKVKMFIRAEAWRDAVDLIAMDKNDQESMDELNGELLE